jgi:alkylation response protein AidB-like acyl-CoA dehydrogenase
MSPTHEAMAAEFAVPDDIQPLIDRVHAFIETEIEPLEDDNQELLGGPMAYLDENERMLDEVHELQSQVRRRAGEEGLYALHMPESVGGGRLLPAGK